MNTLRPIEIVGGGLAGLSLGRALQRHGVPTTIREAGDYPRHRVCGEFITSLSERTKSSLGLGPPLAGACLHRDVAWFLRNELTRVQSLPEPALGISRHTLDARLARDFVEAGGTLHTHARADVGGDVEGRLFATGRRPARSPWLGLKLHVEGWQLAHGLEVHLGEQAYVGVCAVAGSRVNVCGLFRRRPISHRGPPLLLAYLRATGLGTLAARLEDAAIEPDSFCAVAGLGFARRIPASDRIQLGDAAAMIPPFTGNGMTMAFQSAEIAFEPLLAYARGDRSWRETVTRVNASMRTRFRVRLASAGLLHPFLLEPRRQRWLRALTRSRLLPLRPLYAMLH